VQKRLPFNQREVMRLVDFYKFGQRDEPFEQLSREKVSRASGELSGAVIGQPRAIEAVTGMLTTAKVGISLNSFNGRNSQPKGIFFFVGPTGVGKTELAKSLSRLIFGDEEAFARFDMSEYKEEHAAEKLAGSPPGFVGYEEGGQLTNRVLERPYSILLFDEIEKAHPKVLDKFLQILEDGRLTDGKGQTAYFNQTVIIFTSNIGASDLSDPQTGTLIRPGIMNRVQQEGTQQLSYEQVNRHFREEVRWYFSSRIGRAELLNRLGDNIVVFDLLRPEFVARIGEKFLRQLRVSAQEKHQLKLKFQPSVLAVLAEQMQVGDNLLFGGRRIKTLLESLVERPLNRWIFENVADLSALRGRELEIGLGSEADLQVCPR
jgi:ATP-dependent Clp protease ATP-binding subunit ClpA